MPAQQKSTSQLPPVPALHFLELGLGFKRFPGVLQTNVLQDASPAGCEGEKQTGSGRLLPLAVPWGTNGMPAITQPLGASEADWLLYTQAEISHEPRRVTPFGPRVLLESPRISPTALRLGTGSAPITEV